MSRFGSNHLMKFITEENWEKVKIQCKLHPSQACYFVKCPGFFEGMKNASVLPLHQAIRIGAPLDIIIAIVQANQDALQAKETAYQRLPIHIACRASSELSIINFILKHYPEGAQTVDNLGRLPLHYAINNGACEEVIGTLLRRCPGGVRAADYKGWLPLHVACYAMPPTQVFETLIDAYPESVLLATQEGHTPRDILGESESSRKGEIMELLEEAIQSKEGKTFKKWSSMVKGRKGRVVPVVAHSAVFV